MKYIVRSGALIGFPELVEEYGQRPLELLEAVRIPIAALQNQELYLPYTALAKLMTLAAERCAAADFGTRLGSRQGLEAVGALGPLLCLQAQLGDALTLIKRHIGFHARGVAVDVESDQRFTTLQLRLAFSRKLDCTQLIALSVALLVRSIAQLHGSVLRPLELHLAVPEPDDLRGWRSAFGCTPTFDAPVSQVIYPAQLLGLPVRIAENLRQRLNTQWRGQHREARSAPTLVQQAERAIVALLPTGDCNLQRVAGMLELTPRVLQLRLQEESLSFTELLRRTRERLAREHLARTDIDVTSLAMNLGFGDLAVFSRAFKAWTGQSPRDWRREQAA